MTTTYNYCIEETDGLFSVSEGDGPNAPGSGAYDSLEEAKAAVESVAAKSGISDLDWEQGENYWAAQWAAPNR